MSEPLENLEPIEEDIDEELGEEHGTAEWDDVEELLELEDIENVEEWE